MTPALQILKLAIFLSLISTIGSISRAHENRPHGTDAKNHGVDKGISRSSLTMINESYLKTVKPIFQRSCFDCHSSSTNYPWYAALPGAKQLIESDISEAKEHLEMSHDFPFDGHGNPKEDLEVIGKTVKEDSMPPLLYRIMHSDSKLTEEEKATVQKWVNQSLEKFK